MQDNIHQQRQLENYHSQLSIKYLLTENLEFCKAELDLNSAITTVASVQPTRYDIAK